MAPTKKKKKPTANPNRGFSTVSKPSKKVDSAPESEDVPEERPLTGESTAARSGKHAQATSEDGPTGLQSMGPEELEQHLEKAELEMFLDSHGFHAKKEVQRQLRRSATERRSLRQSATTLETESWLPKVIEETLDLATSLPYDQKRSVVTEPRYSDSDLRFKLWTVQQALTGLGFGNINGALKHLVAISCIISNPTSGSLWGFDEAVSWLALNSSSADLPAYMEEHTFSFAKLSSQTPSSAFNAVGGEIINTSDSLSLPYTTPSLPLDEAASSVPVLSNSNQADNGEFGHRLAMTSSENSDDDDPDRLTETFLDARYKLLEASLGGTDDQRQSHRLKKRIQRIERDVLFDGEEAARRWTQIKKDLEIKHGRSGAAEKRQKQGTKQPAPAFACDMERDSVVFERTVNDDTIGDDLFSGIFEVAENDKICTETPTETNTVDIPDETVTLLDLGPIGVGASPKKVLEEMCKASDPDSKVVVRQTYGYSHSSRHSVQISWSRDSNVAVVPSYLPAELSYHFRPRSSNVAMVSIAAPSLSHSEGYVCTIMMFVLSESWKDEKMYLRLQTVWRDVWKSLLEVRQHEVDSADIDMLKHIDSVISTAKPIEQGKHGRPAPLCGENDFVKTLSTSTREQSPEVLNSIWEAKTSTSKYKRMLRVRQQLPIWEHREEVTNTIGAHQVTILCAETGAGKSTQVPSFVLESQLSAGRECNILVTQPRRISAITLAQRVSEELGEEKSAIGQPGSLVGFAIRLESKISSSTRIKYITTGVLLRMLESQKDLEEINYLVLDEVHERTMDMDLIFIVLRRLLQRRQSLKIVLMSATVDARKSSEYFGGAPILTIPGRTFPVEIKYLEDAMELTDSQNDDARGSNLTETYDEDAMDINESERVRSLNVGLQKYSVRTRQLLADYDEYKIDYSLIVNLVVAISREKQLEQYSKAILIFMPGISEIRRLYQVIQGWPAFQSGWTVHLLHSSFSNDDLEKAFERPPRQHRKLVIATNIAETGITIPDVTAVIDSCREKIMRFDERRQISKLTEAFVSRSSARQRRGRAARVQPGLCFHLVTRYRHDHLLPEHHVPEMLRLSLQDPILRIKMWNLGDIEQTLNQAFDPPTSKNVRRAIQLMQDVQALTYSESLTTLGRQLAKLPLDIWLGKIVLYGVTFTCVDATVFIAAMLSAKSPFLDGDRSGGGAAAKTAFNQGNSDLILVYNAYCGWRRACTAGQSHNFCRRNYLNHITLSQIEDQKMQLLIALSDAGILHLVGEERAMLRRYRISSRGTRNSFYAVPDRYNYNSGNEVALNSVIAMALYPKLLTRERNGWRNVANNQQVNISPTSINHHNHHHHQQNAPSPPTPPPNWLSFYQTMQTKSSKNPTVFETSPVAEVALAVVVGEADLRMYAGVILLDGGRVRFRVRDWKTMVAIRALRSGIQDAVRMSWQHQHQQRRSAVGEKDEKDEDDKDKDKDKQQGSTSMSNSAHPVNGATPTPAATVKARARAQQTSLQIWNKIMDESSKNSSSPARATTC